MPAFHQFTSAISTTPAVFVKNELPVRLLHFYYSVPPSNLSEISIAFIGCCRASFITRSIANISRLLSSWHINTSKDTHLLRQFILIKTKLLTMCLPMKLI
jgi:hypothetical protein